MYTKAEASRLQQEFWTAFGQYMAPVPSAEGIKINWINYKTGFKDVFFRMHANNKKAWIGIELSHKDIGVQQLYFEQFKSLKMVLDTYLNEEWEWQLHTHDEHGKTISRIFTELNGVNVFSREYWPKLISFFKERIIALDEFWADARYSFEALR